MGGGTLCRWSVARRCLWGLSSKDGRIFVHVCDDGIGMTGEVDMERTGNVGMQLVSMLTRQLEGTVAADRSRGTTWRLEFPQRA
jgi:two-component system, sensor histidine kinase PdtaS